jgi:uncharacterized membrane protein
MFSNAYQPMNVPGATESVARGINGSGDIVGAYGDSKHQTHDAGLIVGEYVDSNNNYQGFLYNKGTFTAITFPGAIAPLPSVSIRTETSWVLTSLPVPLCHTVFF